MNEQKNADGAIFRPQKTRKCFNCGAATAAVAPNGGTPKGRRAVALLFTPLVFLCPFLLLFISLFFRIKNYKKSIQNDFVFRILDILALFDFQSPGAASESLIEKQSMEIQKQTPLLFVALKIAGLFNGRK